MAPLLHKHLDILATEFTIRTNDSDLFERLPYLAHAAEQEFPLTARAVVDVVRTGAAYRIDGAGFASEHEASLAGAVERLSARLHEAALAALPGHVRIHAASVMHAGRLVLLVGPKRAGKTTLAVHLLLEGFDVVGDELVLLEHGVAVPYPRPFYVRQSAMSLLPRLGETCRVAPFTVSASEGRMVALAPSALGRPWRIAPVTVAACLYLEPDHSGASTIVAGAKVDMIRRVLPQCAPPGGGRRDWIADVCRTVNGAATATLKLGDLATATIALRSYLG